LFGDGRIDGLVEVVEIVGNEVGQVGILGMVPALFNRVQFGRVGRQRLERKPRRMVLLEVCRRRLMHVPAIPRQNHVTAIMTMQQPKQPDQVGRVDVLRHKLEIER